MPSTRSGRTAAASSSTPAQTTANNKRKADAASPASSQASKGGKPAKQQKTLEETIEQTPATNGATDHNDTAKQQNGDSDVPQTTQNGTQNGQSGKEATGDQTNGDAAKKVGEPAHQKPDSFAREKSQEKPSTKADDDVEMKDEEPAPPAEHKQEEKGSATAGAEKDAVQEDKKREEAMPSNILEKGIIYFFTRGRVGVDEPESVQDLQRSHFVLRPIPQGGKITEGAVQESSNNRLVALPKKVFPKSGKDRFMAFVEKAGTTVGALKKEFFSGSEYNTQTAGVRSQSPVAPVGEGVYAITTTGGGQGTTHLVYMLTIPQELGDVQRDMGIAEKGSFVLSMKNPESSGPAYAQLPQKPDFPKEFMEEFRGRGWMPLHPKHLDYANAQMLMIGEDFESSNNLEAKPKDEGSDKVSPEEELQKLEDEDEHRVEALKGDDTVFLDLDISKKEYSILTTW